MSILMLKKEENGILGQGHACKFSMNSGCINQIPPAPDLALIRCDRG